MRIVVCIKQILDPRAPLEIHEKGLSIIEEETYYITNPPDKVAVEEAIRIKERLSDVEVILLAVGPERVSRALRECLSLGADKAIRLASSDNNDVDAYLSAEILFDALKKLTPDLILCGSIGEDNTRGATGIMIAEMLNIPSISDIDKINITETEKAVEVHRKLQRGDREIIKCTLPVLLTVNGAMNNPRYASLPNYMLAMTAIIEERDYTTTNSINRPRLTITSITPPRPRLKKGMTIDSSLSPDDRIKMLMSGGVSQRQSNIIEGKPEEIADKLLNFFINNELIRYKRPSSKIPR